MFELNGTQYTLEQVEEAAKASNITVEEYITKAGLTEVGKQKPTSQTTAAAVGVNTLDTELQSADGSLESQDPAKGFFEQVFGADNDRKETYEQRELRQTIELENKIAETAAKREIDPETGKFKELSSTDKMLNSVGNMADQFQQFVPNLVISSNKIFRGIFGDEAIDSFVANESIPEFFKEGLSDEDLDEAIQQVKLQEAEMQSTGEITKGFAEGDVGEIAAGIVNGITSIGSSLAINTLTAGGGLIPDMIGRSYVDYNSALAEGKGKTLSDLIKDGEDEVTVPAAIGTLSGLLERAGLKGAGKAILNKAVTKGINKTLASMLISGNKEGLTELAQTGLEASNIASAKGENKTEAFVDAVTSREGLEAYLQGFVGGGIITGSRSNVLADRNDILKASSVMRSDSDASFLSVTQQEIKDLQEKRQKTRNKEVKKVIDEKIEQKTQSMRDMLIEENKVINNMSESELYAASKSFDKIEKLSKKSQQIKQQAANSFISSDEQNILLEELNSNLNKERQKLSEIKSNSITRADEALEKNVKTAEEQSSKLDNVSFKSFNTIKDFEDYILSKDKRKTKASKVLAQTNDGVILQNSDGTQEIIINKEIAKKAGAINVGAHELLHGILYKTLKENPNAAVALGNSLTKQINKLDLSDPRALDFKQRLDLYKDEDAATRGEETLTLFGDATAQGLIKYDENLFTKTGDILRRIFDSVGYKRTFKSGRDVYNFIKDYNKDIAKGGIRQAFVQAAKEGINVKIKPTSKIQKAADNVLKGSRSNLNSLLEKYGNDPKTLIAQGLSKTPQGQETFEFTKSEFGQEVAPIVESLTKKLYDPIPEDAKRDVSRNDYKDAMISELATIISTEYDPAKQDIDTFTTIRAFQRSNRLAKNLGIESVQEFGGTGIKTDVTEAKGIAADEVEITANTKKLVDAIGVSKSILDKGDQTMQRAIIKAENAIVGKEMTPSQKVRARDKALSEVFNQQLEKDLKKEFLKTAKNNETFNSFLDKNWKEVAAVYLKNTNVNKIPEGRGKEILQGWNEQFPSKQEVVDYFQGKDLDNKQAISNRKNRSLANAIVKEIMSDRKQKFIKEDPNAVAEFEAKTGIKFSKQLLNIVDKPLFELEQKGVDQLLNSYDLNSTAKYKTEEQINNAILDIKNKLLPLMPREFWFGPAGGSAFTGSSKIIGVKTSSDPLWAYFVGEIKKLSDLPDSSFGAEIEGVDFKVSSYKTLFKDEATIKKNIINGSIDEFNTKVSKIHEAFWNKVNEAITKDKSIAPIIGSYLKIVGNDTKHWHKLGAQFVGYSTNPEGRYEYEHAMPATAAYLYLMDAALSGANFNTAYKAVMDNYKLIALDKAMDKKLTAVGLQRKMPKGWDLTKNFWWERYFNPEVASIDGGIPTESLIFLNGKTAKQELKTNSSGQSRILASKTLDADFNKMLERVKGVKADARYSEDRATKLGAKKGKFKFFIPYSAEDFVGLIYPTLGKGAEGDKNMQWYKDNILNPYATGYRNFEAAKQLAMQQWADLKKQIKKTPANLKKESVRGFSNEEAVRVYLWDKQNTVPDTLAKKDVSELVKYVENTPELLDFATQVNNIVGPGKYPNPQGDWLAGTITTDLVNYTNTVSRKEYLQEWQDNVDVVYSKDNLNKLKALYGNAYVEALQDMLYRMKTGRNRPSGSNKLTNQFMNWINDSVGTIMFFNTRSALLQTISSVNYLNWSDNNPVKAAAAFANQKQFWNDFAEIFNSDFLKQRRSGLKTDVNADEIARMASTADNKVRAALSAILKKGFLPTQLADSFAISIGGTSFYRNRINTYLKEGLSEKEAKEKAFLDFKEITEESQQSSRPDRVSMQQASPLGRVILAFANTPMQYGRLMKKATLDLVNGRGDWKTNTSKILYYGAVQNLIFTFLQQAMFAMLFSDDDDDEEQDRYFRMGNSIADSLLRGVGVGGAVVATAKNLAMKTIEEYKSGRPDYTDVALELTTLSPPINSKLRKLQSAGRSFTYKQTREEMREKGIAIDNPAAEAGGQIISALTNVPADRAIRKMNNLKTATDQDLEMWQSIALALGYSKWDVGIKNSSSKIKTAEEILREAFRKKSKLPFKKKKRKTKKKEDQGTFGNPFKKLEDGVLGKAHKDGTIEIKEGLSPAKKKEVIAHEKKHLADMKSGKLDYDDQNVYWDGKPYPRLQGKKIVYNGVAYLEGHKKLPWEKSANNIKI